MDHAKDLQIGLVMGYVMMPITMLTVVMMVGTAVDQMLTHSIALYVYVWRMVPQLYHLVQALQQPQAQPTL